MTLDMEFTLAILMSFGDNPDAYMPVSLVAKKVDDRVRKAVECPDDTDDETVLSNAFVLHMLHLQDLAAIVNMRGEQEWGYKPDGNGGDFSNQIEQALKTGIYEAPHCYMCEHPRSVIRLTSTGHQLREVLQKQGSSWDKLKRAALYFGSPAMSAGIPILIS